MGMLLLGIVAIGFGMGFVTAFSLLCWTLKVRAKQHGMQAELRWMLSKPPLRWDKKVNGKTQVGSTTWTNFGPYK